MHDDRQETIFPDGLTRVDYQSFLDQHDVVYLAPVVDGFDGLPVGNGDLGAMIWTPPRELRLQINKVDLWDDGPDGPFNSWGDDDEEVSTLLRSAANLTIGHSMPTYDRLYLTDFEARLSLADARVDLRAATPFARSSVRIFASEQAGVLVVRYRDQTEEPVERTIALERWGSRSLLHWYRKIRRYVPRSLLDTEAGCDREHLWIVQHLRDLHFAVAVRCEGAGEPRRLHGRAVVFASPAVAEMEATAYLAVVTSEEASDPLAAAIERVDRAAERGYDALEAEHRRSWRRFWEASFVDLPDKQNYLENHWYLASYHTRSCAQGRYPPNHIDALWAGNRDVRPWAYYYHWNEQIHVWPIHATGHPELAMPYYRWRRAMLDHAVEDARRVHGRSGAFYSDVSNRRGYQDTGPSLRGNLTPGPQIAADFWRQYQYTRDQAFLTEMAYPVIREVTQFYLETVVPGTHGRLTFRATQAYEGNILFDDTLTDLAHARQLFAIFLQASRLLERDDDLRVRCQDVLDNLAPYAVHPVSTHYRVDPNSAYDLRPVLFDPIEPGDPTMPIWHLGYKSSEQRDTPASEIPDGAAVHEGMGDPRKLVWLMSSSNLAPIFPAGQVGLDQLGSEEFDVAVNTVRALGTDGDAFSLAMVSRARLGMADELATALENWPQAFQVYPQGFSHYFLASHPDMETDPRYLKNLPVVGSPGETIAWPIALSTHMSLEAGPMLQFSINEMLLQSYSGTIRVFPAVPGEWEGAFRLHAVGRFVVSARRRAGRTSYVVVESHGGEECRLANPWPGEDLTLYERGDGGWVPRVTTSGAIVTFATQSHDVLLALPVGIGPATLESTSYTGVPNPGPKTLGKARLGMPKGY